jgi:hypothetical protein
MTDIKFGHGSIFKKGQKMEIPEQVRDVVVESINLANPVHWRGLLATPDSLGLEVSYLAVDVGDDKAFNASPIA